MNDDKPLSKKEEAYLDSLIEGLENLVSKLSTTELSYSCNDDKPFCQNHEVACGNYDCNYADVVNNTIICNSNSCNYQSIYKPIELIDKEEEDNCFSCPYFDVQAPDCCKYAPEACYYDPDPDSYPF